MLVARAMVQDLNVQELIDASVIQKKLAELSRQAHSHLHHETNTHTHLSRQIHSNLRQQTRCCVVTYFCTSKTPPLTSAPTAADPSRLQSESAGTRRSYQTALLPWPGRAGVLRHERSTIQGHLINVVVDHMHACDGGNHVLRGLRLHVQQAS